MAERKHGAEAPATVTKVTGEDWYGRELTSTDVFDKVLFVDCDFTELANDGATFTDCTFRNVKFNVSKHTDAAFTNCTFTRCNFFDAEFTRCKMVGSMFSACAWDIAKIERGDWSFVGLPGADLRKATVRDARMRESDLTGVNAAGGILTGLDWAGTWFHRADFTECDLRGSDLSNLDPLTVELARAIITIDQAVTIAEALKLDVRAE